MRDLQSNCSMIPVIIVISDGSGNMDIQEYIESECNLVAYIT